MLSEAKHPYPRHSRELYVYVMSNVARTLYVGVTNDLMRRVQEHKLGSVPGFTAKYRLTRLVYFETTPYVLNAISREKQLKGWTRSKKLALIESLNPGWSDLAAEWEADSSPAAQNDKSDAVA